MLVERDTIDVEHERVERPSSLRVKQNVLDVEIVVARADVAQARARGRAVAITARCARPASVDMRAAERSALFGTSRVTTSTRLNPATAA